MRCCMNEFQKETVTNLVYTFAQRANIANQDQIYDTIKKLCSMNISDSIDTILVSLNDLLNRKMITKEDIFANVESIIKLNPEQYTSVNDLIARLNWIKGMNMEHPNMPYYTGGLMGYLATNHVLERYHGDLDLFINEQQLITLKDLIDSSADFEFISNMAHKEVNGHEYKIVYKVFV